MNVVILSGNLARDPEVRFAPTGKAVTDGSVHIRTQAEFSLKFAFVNENL